MERRSLRLDTLLTLRWLAVAGQTIVIVVVYHGFGFPLPAGWALAAVGISIWLNIALRLKYPNAHRLTNAEAATILAFDIVQLGAPALSHRRAGEPVRAAVPRRRC